MFPVNPTNVPCKPLLLEKRIILLRKTRDLIHIELIPFYVEISIPKKQDFLYFFFLSYITCAGRIMIQKAETCRIIKHLRT
jgi:hypothetical protein